MDARRQHSLGDLELFLDQQVAFGLEAKVEVETSPGSLFIGSLAASRYPHATSDKEPPDLTYLRLS